MNVNRQKLADDLTDRILSEVYGVSYTMLNDLDEDSEISEEWDKLNDFIYEELLSPYFPPEY